MRVYEGSRGIAEPDRGCVLTIGNLDGLHLGHQALIGAVIERAGVLGVPKAVYTFDPHPVQVLFPERAQPRLMSADQLEDGFRTPIVRPPPMASVSYVGTGILLATMYHLTHRAAARNGADSPWRSRLAERTSPTSSISSSFAKGPQTACV